MPMAPRSPLVLISGGSPNGLSGGTAASVSSPSLLTLALVCRSPPQTTGGEEAEVETWRYLSLTLGDDDYRLAGRKNQQRQKGGIDEVDLEEEYVNYGVLGSSGRLNNISADHYRTFAPTREECQTFLSKAGVRPHSPAGHSIGQGPGS